MKILAINAELHIIAGRTNWKEPLRLQICFTDGSTLRLGVSGDGEGLILDRLPLEPPMDLEEHGRTETFDFTDRLEPTLKGVLIGEPAAIRSSAGRLIGLAVPRPGGEPFCIWINGDAFRWGPQAGIEEDYWVDDDIPALGGPLFE
ncbi:MAG TPA: hypothetical protein VE053_12720 [Allosphingosinicella sp.]|nr:hypothetical protein [Allosphingosinicella sp.]